MEFHWDACRFSAASAPFFVSLPFTFYYLELPLLGQIQFQVSRSLWPLGSFLLGPWGLSSHTHFWEEFWVCHSTTRPGNTCSASLPHSVSACLGGRISKSTTCQEGTVPSTAPATVDSATKAYTIPSAGDFPVLTLTADSPWVASPWGTESLASPWGTSPATASPWVWVTSRETG